MDPKTGAAIQEKPAWQTAQRRWQLHPLYAAQYTESRCREILGLQHEIRQLKRQRRAVILAHSYVRSEVLDIADKVSDSYALALEAANVEAEVILFAGVLFMAETAKILNPEKKVLIPSLQAGCSLAESAGNIAEVEAWLGRLQQEHLDLAKVTYINSSAAVKAACDVVVTSSNVRKILEKLTQKHIAFMPDQFMGEFLQTQMPNKVFHLWRGTCMVHEQITPEEYRRILAQWPQAVLLTHMESPLATSEMSHFVGSTTQMMDYAAQLPDGATVVLGTACGIPTILREKHGQRLNIVGGCYTCPHMERNTIESVAEALRTLEPEIQLPPSIMVQARRSLQRMIQLAR